MTMRNVTLTTSCNKTSIYIYFTLFNIYLISNMILVLVNFNNHDNNNNNNNQLHSPLHISLRGNRAYF